MGFVVFEGACEAIRSPGHASGKRPGGPPYPAPGARRGLCRLILLPVLPGLLLGACQGPRPPEAAGPAPLPAWRYEHQVVPVGRLVYVVGGVGGSRRLLAGLDILDPARNTWGRGAPMATPRAFFCAAEAGGCIYAISGRGPGHGKAPLASVERYEPSRDLWTRVADIPAPRTHAAAATLDGRIHVLGGVAADGTTITRRVDVYDPETGSWSRGPELPHALHGAAAVVLGGRLHVLGGAFEEPRAHLVLERGRWQRLPDMPRERVFHVAAVLEGRIWICGGGGGKGGGFRRVLVYDPRRRVWTQGPDMQLPRYHAGGAAVGGRILVFGGVPLKGVPARRLREVEVIRHRGQDTPGEGDP